MPEFPRSLGQLYPRRWSDFKRNVQFAIMLSISHNLSTDVGRTSRNIGPIAIHPYMYMHLQQPSGPVSRIIASLPSPSLAKQKRGSSWQLTNEPANLLQAHTPIGQPTAFCFNFRSKGGLSHSAHGTTAGFRGGGPCGSSTHAHCTNK